MENHIHVHVLNSVYTFGLKNAPTKIQYLHQWKPSTVHFVPQTCFSSPDERQVSASHYASIFMKYQVIHQVHMQSLCLNIHEVHYQVIHQVHMQSHTQSVCSQHDTISKRDAQYGRSCDHGPAGGGKGKELFHLLPIIGGGPADPQNPYL